MGRYPAAALFRFFNNHGLLSRSAGAAPSLVLALQLLLMIRFLRDPIRYAVWFSGFGVSLYVLGMLASAFAARNVLIS